MISIGASTGTGLQNVATYITYIYMDNILKIFIQELFNVVLVTSSMTYDSGWQWLLLAHFTLVSICMFSNSLVIRLLIQVAKIILGFN